MPTELTQANLDTCCRCQATWIRATNIPAPKRCKACRSHFWDDPGHRGPGRPPKDHK